MRSSTLIRSSVVIGGLAAASFLLLAPSKSQIQPKALVVLQGTTPGAAQTGNLSISGVGLFGSNVGIGLTNPSFRLDVNGQIRCTGFRLNSAGGVGKVLTSDASGLGTWQTLPVDSLTLPYSGTASSAVAPLFLVTNTADGPSIQGNSSGLLGRGIQGINSASAGTGIGVYGEAQSPDGYGVVGRGSASTRDSYGRLGAHYDALTTPDLNVAVGVMGESRFTGVYGRGNSGPGVSGESASWIGVGGWTNTGYGVRGQALDPSGVGVDAVGSGITAASQGTALSIREGAIAVDGAGLGTATPVFIHRAIASNIAGNVTYIDNPLTNGDPNAILIITSNWNPGGVGGTYNNHATGVYYAGTRWAIFNQDLAAMPVNAAFNVLVVKTQATLQGDGMSGGAGMIKPGS